MNAVVLSFDCLPVDFLGCYGCLWLATPNFDRLASEAVVFEQHYAENFDNSARNHAWVTGRFQFPRSKEQQQAQPIFATVLKERGIQSRLIFESPLGSPFEGLKQLGQPTEVRVAKRSVRFDSESSFGRLVSLGAETLHELATDPSRRWLLWLKSRGVPDFPVEQELQPDEPVDVTASQRRADRQRLADAVSELDRSLGEFLDSVGRLSRTDDLLLVVTAAEGVSPSVWADLPTTCAVLPDPLVWTPLFVRHAGPQLGSRRNALTQAVDLVPTLLEWFEVESEAFWCEGRSLMPLLHNQVSELRGYICFGSGDGPRSIRTEGFKLTIGTQAGNAGRPDGRALFVKPDDLMEVNDVQDQFPETAETLTATLERFVEEASRLIARAR